MHERTKLRLRRLIKPRAVPPWAIALWGAVNFSSNVQFVLNLFGRTWPHIILLGGKVQGALLMLLGFAWLGALVMRPEKRLAVADLRLLGANKLRNYTVDLTEQLRNFEATERERDSIADNADWQAMARVEVEPAKRIAWDTYTAKMMQRRAAHERAYKTLFHADVMALYDVLRERVGDVPNEPYGTPPPLSAGMLAGVHPVQAAADYLDKMARRLT
jgi:hypothetical protein